MTKRSVHFFGTFCTNTWSKWFQQHNFRNSFTERNGCWYSFFPCGKTMLCVCLWLWVLMVVVEHRTLNASSVGMERNLLLNHSQKEHCCGFMATDLLGKLTVTPIKTFLTSVRHTFHCIIVSRSFFTHYNSESPLLIEQWPLSYRVELWTDKTEVRGQWWTCSLSPHF